VPSPQANLKGADMPIELVVFDMSGTVVNDGDAVNRCFRSAMTEARFTATPEQVNAVMGWAKPAAIRHLLQQCGVRGATLEQQIESIHVDFVTRMMHHYRTADDVSEMPGARQTFAELREEGIRVALNTGFSRAIAQIIIDRFGWQEEGLIDASVTSDEVPRGRPAPDMILELMRMTGVTEPSHVAKVGDTPVDLEEGTNVGCGFVIGITHGTHTRAQLVDFPHTHLIATLDGLAGLMAGDPTRV